MGDVDYAPGEPKGTPWHPHRGFETVTYMLDGIFQHQDSNGGLITDGDTQWMTAGAVLPTKDQGTGLHAWDGCLRVGHVEPACHRGASVDPAHDTP
jgi:hypothetical protein